jgi:hypothetical protein
LHEVCFRLREVPPQVFDDPEELPLGWKVAVR